MVEITPVAGNAVGRWLAILDAASLAKLTIDFGSRLRRVAESMSHRFELPAAVCEKYSLEAGRQVWLVGVDDYLEVWSDSAYQAQEHRALIDIFTAQAGPSADRR